MPRPIQEAHPLKQGLKPALSREYVLQPNIQEAHPLKQGLKQKAKANNSWQKSQIQEAHPLKQGLKRYDLGQVFRVITYSRGTSTKTRIETVQITGHNLVYPYSRGTSTKTRIETITMLLLYTFPMYSRGTSTKTRIETKWNV